MTFSTSAGVADLEGKRGAAKSTSVLRLLSSCTAKRLFFCRWDFRGRRFGALALALALARGIERKAEAKC